MHHFKCRIPCISVLDRELAELVVHVPVEVVPQEERPEPVERVHIGDVEAKRLSLLQTVRAPFRVHLQHSAGQKHSSATAYLLLKSVFLEETNGGMCWRNGRLRRLRRVFRLLLANSEFVHFEMVTSSGLTLWRQSVNELQEASPRA